MQHSKDSMGNVDTTKRERESKKAEREKQITGQKQQKQEIGQVTHDCHYVIASRMRLDL